MHEMNGDLRSGVDLSGFRDEYPWDSKWFERGSLRMHYLDEGAGESVVFVHGNPTWSFYWRRLVKELSADHRCVAPDHMGMGLSDKPSDGDYTYTLESRVDDLEALLDHLGMTDNITLVLHDWGGMIGLAFAQRHPDRIARLVLMNTAGFFLPEGRGLPWQLWLIKNLPFAVPVRGLNAFVVGALHTCSTRPGRMTESVKKGYVAPYDSWAHRIAVHRFVQDIPLSPGHPSFDVVEGVNKNLEQWRGTPVQIFWGEKDFVFDMHFLAEWRRRLPDAEFHQYPDCGHYILEDAHEEILPLVRTFLAAHPIDPAS
jgi:cis-3-alkyl-4-acyloxetan-2-one decarboxylase